MTALLFKMEEANLASRAKAQELIQATNQVGGIVDGEGGTMLQGLVGNRYFPYANPSFPSLVVRGSALSFLFSMTWTQVSGPHFSLGGSMFWPLWHSCAVTQGISTRTSCPKSDSVVPCII